MTPRALRTGDRVAVVSPCGPVLDRALLDGSMALARSWGLDVVEGAHARRAVGHLAGSDDQRVADLNAAIADPTVRAIWVTRGGYGLTRILDRVAWGALAADPTLLVGFSDVSALLVAAWRRLALVSVHGPVLGALSRQPTDARDRLRAVLFGGGDGIALAGRPLVATPAGPATGRLVGGNLTVLAALAGTPDRLGGGGHVLLLEDVGEAPYRLDRLLTQLRCCGAFADVAGVAVGTPVRCAAPPSRPSASADEVIAERLGDLGVPVVTDLPVGHMPGQRAVLHGGAVTLDGAAGVLVAHDRLDARVARTGRA